MGKFFLFIIIITVFSLNIYSQPILWKQTDKSLNGNVYVITHQGDVIFAGTMLGVHKSTDDGNTWVLSNTGLKNTNVFGLAVKSANEIFCGTHGGVYYSSNNGNTWIERNNGLEDNYINMVYVHPSGEVYAGTLYSGMFKTKDNGLNWTKVLGGFDTVAVNTVATRPTGEIYVGTTSGVFRSDASGKNYKYLENDLPEGLNTYSIAVRSNGTVFVATRYGEIYRTSDNSAHWKLVFELNDSKQIYSVIVGQSGAVLIGTYGHGIWRSNDNGDNWELISDGLTNLNIMGITEKSLNTFFCGTWGSGAFRGSDPNITTSAEGTYCAGSDIEVNFTTKTPYQSDNIFTVQLSDTNGLFGKPVNIGTMKGTTGGNITGKIPVGTPQGNRYRVRVISSNAPEIGMSSTGIITINSLPKMNLTGKLRVCELDQNQYGIQSELNVKTTWAITGGSLKSPSASDTIDVLWDKAGNGTITLVRVNQSTGCSDSASTQVIINPLPPKPTITRMANLLVSSANTGNQWYSFGKKLDGQTDKTLELKEPGLYQVVVTDVNGCKSDSSLEFDYNVYSVREKIDNKYITIYPNPVSNFINIRLNDYVFSELNIELSDLLGQTVLAKSIGNQSIAFIQLDVQNINSGSYLLKISDGIKYFAQKIIISR